MNAVIEVTAVRKRFGPVLALDAAVLQPGRIGRDHLLWPAHSQGLGARCADWVAAQAGLETAIRGKAGGLLAGDTAAAGDRGADV